MTALLACCRDHETPDCAPGRVHDWADYSLIGDEEGDYYLGLNTSVGDVDRDGLSDILLSGYNGLHAYLILGSTLLLAGPGTCSIQEVADYTFILSSWEVTGSSGYGTREYSGVDVGVRIEEGALWMGNPSEPSLPILHQVSWETLSRVGPGEYQVGEVADVEFNAAYPLGTDIMLCDVTDDGVEDLLLGEGYSYPGYLLPGPFSSPSMDLDARGMLMYGEGDVDQGPGTLGDCADYNNDGIDDFSLAWKDPVTRQFSANIYFGGDYVEDEAFLNLSHPSLSFITPPADYEVLVSPDSVADWNMDGYNDFLIGTSFCDPSCDVAPLVSEVLLFTGGANSFPAGTSLSYADRQIALIFEDGDGLGRAATMGGDLNGDSSPDLVLGHPDFGGSEGRVYIRYSPLERGDYDIEDVAETIYESFPDSPYQGELLGNAVFLSGDINGDGLDDMIVTAPYSSDHGALYVTVHQD